MVTIFAGISIVVGVAVFIYATLVFVDFLFNKFYGYRSSYYQTHADLSDYHSSARIDAIDVTHSSTEGMSIEIDKDHPLTKPTNILDILILFLDYIRTGDKSEIAHLEYHRRPHGHIGWKRN